MEKSRAKLFDLKNDTYSLLAVSLKLEYNEEKMPMLYDKMLCYYE